MRAANQVSAIWTRGILLLGGMAIGLMSITLAWNGPAFSLGGTSAVAAASELIAGWTLVAGGVASLARRPASRFGWLVGLGGIAWFASEWANPASAGPLVFTVGLAVRVAYPVVIGHAALAFPSGRIDSSVERTVIALAYLTNIVVLGLLPALFFEPAAERCAACPDNLLAIGSNPVLVASSLAVGLRLELAWTAAVVVLLLHRMARASQHARRLTAPVILPAAAVLLFEFLTAIHAIQRGGLSNDEVDLALWAGQAIAIALLGIGIELEGVRLRRARQHVARVAVGLAGSPPTGTLRTSLAEIVGDPGLQVAYAMADGRFADAEGRPAEVVLQAGRTATRVEREGDLVAVLCHRSDLLDDPERLREAIAAARITIENEQLQARIRVGMADMQASRARIVEASDRERRRLERDLHDGAQQRLVALSMAVGVERLRLGPAAGRPEGQRLAQADEELRQALSDLRELAHGIYPIELVDGLAAGVSVLAEGAQIPIAIIAVPDRRFDPAIESAAYFVIAEAALRSGATQASVNVRVLANRLMIAIDAFGSPVIDLTMIQDRVGALDGAVTIHELPAPGIGIDVDIPCAS